jgi:Mg-chelatase subunit ChlD
VDPATWPADALRVQPPRRTITLDVVLALDVIASMHGAGITQLGRALIGATVRARHRVAVQLFAASVTPLSRLPRAPDRLFAAAVAYEPANPTNLENAIHSAHELLARTGSRSAGGVMLLVTDAEPTTCGSARRRPRGFGAVQARLAALDAAAAALADGISVSVLCPPPGTVACVDTGFAERLARAGGGVAASWPTTTR